MCPECGSNDIVIEHYDCGVCRETGYHDAGEMYHCRECGARGDADEIDATLPTRAGDSVQCRPTNRPSITARRGRGHPGANGGQSSCQPQERGKSWGPGFAPFPAGGMVAQSL